MICVNLSSGNLGSDVAAMLNFFRNGVTYESVKETDALSKLQVPFGRVSSLQF